VVVKKVARTEAGLRAPTTLRMSNLRWTTQNQEEDQQVKVGFQGLQVVVVVLGLGVPF
jgi:hypothetical protein